MLIYAGKTYSSRYDKRAPVHVAMVDPDGDEEPRNLCSGMTMAPVSFGGSIDVTCKSCAEAVMQLQQLVSA